MTDYVVGLLFSPTKSAVLLVRKRRPKWQVGLLNGPGGAINPDEDPADAMAREFNEEVGVRTVAADWLLVAIMDFPVGRGSFFTATNGPAFQAARTVTDEEVVRVLIKDLHAAPLVRNLHYLIPLCLHYDAAASGSKLVIPVSLIEQDAAVGTPA